MSLKFVGAATKPTGPPWTNSKYRVVWGPTNVLFWKNHNFLTGQIKVHLSGAEAWFLAFYPLLDCSNEEC